jgi:hypothetical protein
MICLHRSALSWRARFLLWCDTYNKIINYYKSEHTYKYTHTSRQAHSPVRPRAFRAACAAASTEGFTGTKGPAGEEEEEGGLYPLMGDEWEALAFYPFILLGSCQTAESARNHFSRWEDFTPSP